MNTRRMLQVVCVAAGLAVAPLIGSAQEVAIPPGAPAAPARPTFSQPQLDQLLAPIALYPDSLLSQVLMASTYPIEVVQADRWVTANPALKGDPLADALEQQTWDPSVKSLVNFPQVLAMMSEKLDWTTQLGDAFLSQEQQVSDTVQSLRAKAQAAGTLKTTAEQQVTVDNASGPPEIIIQPANPDVVYVPVYDPNVIYGPWWEPTYPPYYYYPPGYVRGPGIRYGTGFGYGVAWGYAWGSWDWRHHDVIIDFRRNENYNRRIDRDRYRTIVVKHDPDFHGESGQWQHDPDHRRGVWYRDSVTAQRFNAPQRAAAGERDREIYRGRDDSPRYIAGKPQAQPTPQDIRRDSHSADSPHAQRASPDTHRDSHSAETPHAQPASPDTRRDSHSADTPREEVRQPTPPAEDSRLNGPMHPSRSTDTGGALRGMDGGRATRSESQRGSESRSGGASRSGGSGGGQLPNENRGPSNYNSSGPGNASSGPGNASSGPGNATSGGNSNAPTNNGGGNSGGGRSGGNSRNGR